MTEVRGTVESGFEAVRATFERGFEKGELGAAVAAYVDGRKVVDLWGGWADADRTRQWQPDTIACTFSATKGMTRTLRSIRLAAGWSIQARGILSARRSTSSASMARA